MTLSRVSVVVLRDLLSLGLPLYLVAPALQLSFWATSLPERLRGQTPAYSNVAVVLRCEVESLTLLMLILAGLALPTFLAARRGHPSLLLAVLAMAWALTAFVASTGISIRYPIGQNISIPSHLLALQALYALAFTSVVYLSRLGTSAVHQRIA